MKIRKAGLANTIWLFLAFVFSLASVHAQSEQKDQIWLEPKVQTAKAVLKREYKAQEARQGASVDKDHVYAIVNSVIGKYDKKSGQLKARWTSPRGGYIRHINSCFVHKSSLLCANSNFPDVPMGSSVEMIDTKTMTHTGSHSLGLLDEGSLTFFDIYREKGAEGWIAGFAHYDDKGGVGYKKSQYASIVTYDGQWRRTGGWLIPNSVQTRMAPHAASGGSLGPDGYLYLMGHDRPELYVLAKPKKGPFLIHIATIEIDAEGQAFSWDRSVKDRMLYAISRPNGVIRAFEIPSVNSGNADELRFVNPLVP